MAAIRPTTRSPRHASISSTSACAKNGFFSGVSRSCSDRRSGGIQWGSDAFRSYATSTKRRHSRRPETARTTTGPIVVTDYPTIRYRRAVRHSEWVALVYFVFLALAAIRRLPGRRPIALLALSTLSGACVVATASEARSTIRDWAPLVYVLVGYYASGLLFVRP